MGYYSSLVDTPVEKIKKDDIAVLIRGLRGESTEAKRGRAIKKTIDAIDFYYEDKDGSYSDFMQLCMDMAISLLMGCEGNLSKLDRCTVCSEALKWLERLDEIIAAKDTFRREKMLRRGE